MIFSVIIPFLNEEAHIERCIQSLLNQDFPRDKYEIIFIDNDSTDRSREIVLSYPELILITEKKIGAYAARNRGLSIARGDIIAFTDADCMPTRDWLKNIMKGMYEKNAEIVLGSRSFNRRNGWFSKSAQDYENSKIDFVLRNDLKNNVYCYTNNMAVKSNLFKTFGCFADVKRGGDTLFIQKYVAVSDQSRIAYLSDMVIVHLEIASIFSWLKKIYIRGKNNLGVSENSKYQKLDFFSKLKIFQNCIRENQYNFLSAANLLLTLFCGECAYRLGELNRI